MSVTNDELKMTAVGKNLNPQRNQLFKRNWEWERNQLATAFQSADKWQLRMWSVTRSPNKHCDHSSSHHGIISTHKPKKSPGYSTQHIVLEKGSKNMGRTLGKVSEVKSHGSIRWGRLFPDLITGKCFPLITSNTQRTEPSIIVRLAVRNTGRHPTALVAQSTQC